jgi:hypothetical protein
LTRSRGLRTLRVRRIKTKTNKKYMAKTKYRFIVAALAALAAELFIPALSGAGHGDAVQTAASMQAQALVSNLPH